MTSGKSGFPGKENLYRKTTLNSEFKFSPDKICWSTGPALSRITRQILLNNSTKVNLMPMLQQILSDENLKFLRVQNSM